MMKYSNFIVYNSLRLLALRGWWTLCVRLRCPSVAWVTLVNYMGHNISIYVYLGVEIDITRKIKFFSLKIFDV